MWNDFGVTTTLEPVPSPCQVGSELCVIVNLTVLDGEDAPRVVSKGLMSSLHIDDAETPRRKSDTSARELTTIVWTAVPHGVAHLCHRRLRLLRRDHRGPDEPADAAHQKLLTTEMCGSILEGAP